MNNMNLSALSWTFCGLLAISAVALCVGCAEPPTEDPPASTASAQPAESSPYESPEAKAILREKEQEWGVPAGSFEQPAGVAPIAAPSRPYLEARHQRLLSGDRATWNHQIRISLRGPVSACMNYRMAHDGSWPTDLDSLAPFCFSWPSSGPPTAPRFQMALSNVSQGALLGSWLVVGPESTTIESTSWPCVISEKTLRPGISRHPFTLSGNFFSRNELGLWSTLRSDGPWIAIGDDARRLFAGRELEMLVQQAVNNGPAWPTTLAEIETWSGHDLVNLVPVDPAVAHVQLLTNGIDAYRVIVSYPGGVTEDSVCEAVLAGSGRSVRRTLPFVEFDRTQSIAWQPIGAWQLEPAATAQLGPQGFSAT